MSRHPDHDYAADTDGDVNDEASGQRLIYLGLDGEMSAADITAGGKLIQAGFAAWISEPGGQLEVFTSLIRQQDMHWCERSASVHQIDRATLDTAPDPEDVDQAAYTWLLSHGAVDGKRTVIPIGLNVGTFDMPFFRQTLPRTSSLISRRAIDLNAICFTYAGWDPNPRSGSVRDFHGWKRSMKTVANTELARRGYHTSDHNAGHDAAQALLGWWWLRRQTVELTARIAELDNRLDAAQPLRTTLGDGLITRLEQIGGLHHDQLTQIVTALGPGLSVRRWFGTTHPDLGCTPLAALQAGRTADVIAASGA
jgi:hypothetical protein